MRFPQHCLPQTIAGTSLKKMPLLRSTAGFLPVVFFVQSTRLGGLLGLDGGLLTHSSQDNDV